MEPLPNRGKCPTCMTVQSGLIVRIHGLAQSNERLDKAMNTNATTALNLMNKCEDLQRQHDNQRSTISRLMQDRRESLLGINPACPICKGDIRTCHCGE